MELCEWHSLVHSFHRYFLSLYPGTMGVAVGFCDDWHRWDLAFTELTEKGAVGSCNSLPEEGTLP